MKKISVMKQQTKQIFFLHCNNTCKTLLAHTQCHCCHNKSANTNSTNSFSRPTANTLNLLTQQKRKNLANQNLKPNLHSTPMWKQFNHSQHYTSMKLTFHKKFTQKSKQCEKRHFNVPNPAVPVPCEQRVSTSMTSSPLFLLISSLEYS